MNRKPKPPLLAFLQRACNSAIVCEDAGTSEDEAIERRLDARNRLDTRPAAHSR